MVNGSAPAGRAVISKGLIVLKKRFRQVLGIDWLPLYACDDQLNIYIVYVDRL